MPSATVPDGENVDRHHRRRVMVEPGVPTPDQGKREDLAP